MQKHLLEGPDLGHYNFSWWKVGEESRRKKPSTWQDFNLTNFEFLRRVLYRCATKTVSMMKFQNMIFRAGAATFLQTDNFPII